MVPTSRIVKRLIKLKFNMASKEKELIVTEGEEILLFMLLRRISAKKTFSGRKI